MSRHPLTEEELITYWARRFWHETDCPAHSNQMEAESECNCLLGAVLDALPTIIKQSQKLKGGK